LLKTSGGWFRKNNKNNTFSGQTPCDLGKEGRDEERINFTKTRLWERWRDASGQHDMRGSGKTEERFYRNYPRSTMVIGDQTMRGGERKGLLGEEAQGESRNWYMWRRANLALPVLQGKGEGMLEKAQNAVNIVKLGLPPKLGGGRISCKPGHLRVKRGNPFWKEGEARLGGGVSS